ncbi:hypothetical protein HNP24_002352 [Chryseobacterium sediminis]|uniref:Uncharacterized protein n=1 Tax=Chryseobacterium sediminis TaxID=1679494 RepID=A0ABR6Q0B3_9FLAO|nr:hypothetical protein [Chryseobacterium sediminis]MBB6331402.1 hypothetical protein [Chryseobacterium sediminis]
MKKIKFLLLTGAVFLATISCSNTEQDEQDVVSQLNPKQLSSLKNSQRISNSDLEAASKVFSSLQPLYDTSGEGALAYDIYSQWLQQKKINAQLDPNLKSMMSFSYEENIAYLLKNNYLNTAEAEIINKLNTDLLNSVQLDVALSNFERSIGTLTLSEKKKEIFSNFVDALTIIDYNNPGYFEVNTSTTGRLFGSCLSATIGFGITAACLATVEVGSWGSATVLTCAGYVWASGEWVAACRKK